jgi:opacity protein-like surface antigen
MLRRILLASAGAMALAGMALAADLPGRGPPPVYLPPPVFTWTGFYAGLNAGYTFGGSNSVEGAIRSMWRPRPASPFLRVLSRFPTRLPRAPPMFCP